MCSAESVTVSVDLKGLLKPTKRKDSSKEGLTGGAVINIFWLPRNQKDVDR